MIPLRPEADANVATPGGRRRRRLDWANLLRRVFGLEMLICGVCGGKRRVIAAIEAGPVARRILEHLHLPTQPPERAPARGSPQAELALDPAPDDFDQRLPETA